MKLIFFISFSSAIYVCYSKFQTASDTTNHLKEQKTFIGANNDTENYIKTTHYQVTAFKSFNKTLKGKQEPLSFGSCSCSNFTCSCCGGLFVKSLDIDVKICFDLIYTKEDYGLEIKMSVNDNNILDKKVSAKNPPPVCFGESITFDIADICLVFYDITISEHSFSSCLELDLELKPFKKAHIPLGCINLGSNVSFSAGPTVLLI